MLRVRHPRRHLLSLEDHLVDLQEDPLSQEDLLVHQVSQVDLFLTLVDHQDLLLFLANLKLLNVLKLLWEAPVKQDAALSDNDASNNDLDNSKTYIQSTKNI